MRALDFVTDSARAARFGVTHLPRYLKDALACRFLDSPAPVQRTVDGADRHIRHLGDQVDSVSFLTHRHNSRNILRQHMARSSHTILFPCTLTVLYSALSTLFPWRFTIVHERSPRNRRIPDLVPIDRATKWNHLFRLRTIAQNPSSMFDFLFRSHFILEKQNSQC